MANEQSKHHITNCAIVILAAGRSSRLGHPKQLLPYKEHNLLQHTIGIASSSGARPIIVVLGANKELIAEKIKKQQITIIENGNWESGIASSIKAGLHKLQEISPEADGLILMVCDQPFVNAELVENLISRQQETNKAIAACSYQDTLGTPALFHKSLFDELLSLEGDIGAKKLIAKHKDLLCSVYFADGGIDIDTPEDYKNLAK
jgi:molybdenum cofactor cytidylyltransferase